VSDGQAYFSKATEQQAAVNPFPVTVAPSGPS
jgi:hypothetical protein